MRHAVVVGDGEESLSVLLTLQTQADGTTLTEDAQRWFRHARYSEKDLSGKIIY